MMPLLLAAIIAGLAAQDRAAANAALPMWPHLAVLLGGSLLAWLAICLIARARLLRQSRGRNLMRWELVGQGLALGWFAWICLGLGWATAMPATVLALVPYLVLMLVHWACLAAPIARLTGEPWTPASHIMHQLRFSAAPLIVGLVLIHDVASALLTSWLGAQSVDAETTYQVAITIIAVIFAPPLLVRILGARPMPPGPLRDRLTEACAAMGFPGAKLMHWPVPLGRFYNAMVVGALPRLRYVVFSDDLLRDLQDRELLAVLGHELGHTHHRHLLFYVGLMLASVGVIAIAPRLFDMGSIQLPEWLHAAPQLWLDAAGTMIGLFIMYRLVFGVASRACEREADLAGVRLSGDPEAMESALKTVARLSGQAETEPNWRHRSIAERVDYLRQVRADPRLATNHHRRMRYSLILLIAIMVASLAIHVWLNPQPAANATAAEASTSLEQWQQTDEDLRLGLANADTNGDPTVLSKWYQRANNADRRRLLSLHILMLRPGEGEAPGSKDPLIYQYRRRLTAFSGIDAGSPELNLLLDNTLAYGLVAGTTSPTAQDLEQARRLLPNLELSVAKDPDHALFDTIGCVHFALGNYTKARDAFANARNRLANDHNLTQPLLSQLEDLYGRRLAATERNITAATSGGMLEKLPLDWTPPVSDTPPVEPPAPAPVEPEAKAPEVTP